MADGSDAIADWPLLNALVNTRQRRVLGVHPPRRRRRHRPLDPRRAGLRRRRHRAGRAEDRAGAHQRPGHGRDPARRRGLRPRRRRRRASGRPRPDAGDRDDLTATGSRALWAEIAPIGRDAGRRLSAVRAGRDAELVAARLVPRPGRPPRHDRSTDDGNGNLFAWWGDAGRRRRRADRQPLRLGAARRRLRRPARHRQRVPRRRPAARAPASRPARPIGVAAFAEEEGAPVRRALPRLPAADRRDRPGRGGRADRPRRGDASAEALGAPRRPARSARPAASRIGAFVELHVEQGRALDARRSAWPARSGRTAAGGCDFAGEGNHAGTTRMADRRDPMLTFALHGAGRQQGGPAAPARTPPSAGSRSQPERHQRDPVAGARLARRPGGRRPRRWTRWSTAIVQARRPSGPAATAPRSRSTAESVTAEVAFDTALAEPAAPRCSATRRCCRPAPATTPGCSSAHVPTAMLFVRNPTGVSHAPAEHATDDDCAAGVDALADVLDGAGMPVTGPARTSTPGIDGSTPTGPGSATRSRATCCIEVDRRPVHRGHRRASAAPPDARPAARADPARPGQRALARVPPGPARAHPRRPGQLLDLAGADVRASPAGSTRTATSRWPGPSTPRWRWPASPASASSTTCTTAPDGAPYADPNAMGHALIEAAARGRHPDHPAGHALPDLHRGRCSRCDGRAAAVRRRGPRRLGRPRADARHAGDAHARIGAAVHSVRAVPADAARPVVAGRRRGRPLHVHLSEQRAENEACLAVHGRTPTECSPTPASLGPGTTAVHATHLTDADRTALGDTGTGVCFCPTTERDLADGIGPARALADAGSPLSLGSDSHAVIDLFEEARGGGDWTSGCAPSGAATSRRPSWCAPPRSPATRALGWADAGRDRASAPAPTWSRSRWTACARPASTPAGGASSPPPPPTSPTWSWTAGSVVRDGRHVTASTCRPTLRGGDRGGRLL